MIDDHCQYWHNESAGILTSPDYGINGIGHRTISIANSNCTWILKADEESYINLEIDFFNVRYRIRNITAPLLNRAPGN